MSSAARQPAMCAARLVFYRELAARVRPDSAEKQAAFIDHLDSPRRVIIEIVPTDRIGFDAEKLFVNSPSRAHPDASAATMPSTLIHGDLRADNLLFSSEHTTVTLIDWQGCGVGPPAFDLAYFLTQSLTVETRRQHEDELLEFYRSELRSAGTTASPQQVRAGYAESMIYGLAVACALPIISDRGETRVKTLTATVARRSLDAMHDHAQLWSTA